MAETFPGSLAINFRELSFDTLAEFVEMRERSQGDYMRDLDIVSVESVFENWWKNQMNNHLAGKPLDWLTVNEANEPIGKEPTP